MNYNKLKLAGLMLTMTLTGSLFAGCEKDSWPDDMEFPGTGIPGDGEGSAPEFDPAISSWNGEKADDAASDKVDPANADIYHEANTFTEKVVVSYSDKEATVTVAEGSKVNCSVSGTYVVIDMLTNSVKDVDIIASGKCSDGQLKIYGNKKFMLTLDGLDLTCSKGPAINDQCKKRVFVHLPAGTDNSLTDATSYSDEPYYLNGANPDDEDRKGCFFSEGNMIFSGTGVLRVAGKYRHGIATDGYMWMRPGVTLVVTEAAKNAVHVKGDSGDGIGFHMAGGLLYTNVASLAGKGIKTDLDAVIAGGQLMLNQSGDATYDESEKDTSSASGIKTDGNVVISGGTHIIKSTGTGGKGINSDGTIQISGGTTTVTTSGEAYYKSANITSSPKGVKAEGDITITDGTLNIAVTGSGKYGSPEGLESKSVLTIDGGTVYSYATDDAINAINGLSINGGYIYAYSVSNDGIDSNGYLHINGGVVIANGGTAPEEAIDCDNSSKYLINGGTVIGIGGNCMQAPSSSSKQQVAIYNGLSLSKGDVIAIINASGTPLSTYEIPRGMSRMTLTFSSPDMKSGETYTISSGGKLNNPVSQWNGWYNGGSWTDGKSIGTFTMSSTVTVIGSGNMGGHGGGWRPM